MRTGTGTVRPGMDALCLRDGGGNLLGDYRGNVPSCKAGVFQLTNDAISMTKRIALVTGGMGGLGEAISIRLHDAGHAVVVTHSPGNANAGEWLATMAASGREMRAYEVDVSDYDACQACAARILADVGQVDILVNNAGITRDMAFKKMDKPNWDAVMRTNLDSVFNLTKPLCEGMVERGWGRIINISSVNGSKGAFGQTNYAAAKAGMHGFTKSLALEVARKGVTVNTVSPGYLATRMVNAVPREIMETKILPQIPVGRVGKPEEVAALVAFLCSEDAAYVTGSNIAINGGQHMQ
ncbi:Acetoacetyl-CoA reductase [Cupriavidus taiwanensis]|nr:Acetoacetyl-CoA reductase [Cupriavidus taiwanensis]SPA50000.1 Acetoacetyl-CoA reductase [Cupriavidus taiwanensis]